MTDHDFDSAVRVRIVGRVQGVWFRAWTEEEARKRDLRGWVQNRRDGSVEAVFAGSASAVEEMVKLCWRGPPAAQVEDIAISSTDANTLGPRFIQRETI